MKGKGASNLAIEIAQARPQPPDVAVAGQVPGGRLIAVTPGTPAQPVSKRTNWTLSFPLRQGFLNTIRRIHVVIPVVLEEIELVTSTQTTVKKQKYASKKEAEESRGGKGGVFTTSETVVQLGGEVRFERETTKFKQTLEDVGEETNVVKTEEETTTERSVLPVTVTVVVRINGPDGEIWADSYDVPIRFIAGAAGHALGAGVIDAYSDLVNGLDVNPDQQFGLEVLVFVPSAAATNIQLGAEVQGGEVKPGIHGEITLFYDLATVPVGK